MKDVLIAIDGYNVLFQTPLMVTLKDGKLDSQLSRKRLLAFVSLVIASKTLSKTVVVFDAKQVRTVEAKIEELENGLRSVYASNYSEADQYIEELISKHRLPKSLVVITSDGKIKSMARSYASKTIESRDWFEQSLAKISVVDQQWIREGSLPESFIDPEPLQPSVDSRNRIPDLPRLRNQAMRNLDDDDLASFEDFDVPG